MNPSSFSNFDTVTNFSTSLFDSTFYGESHELNLTNNNDNEWIVDLFPTFNYIFCTIEKDESKGLDEHSSLYPSSAISIEQQIPSKKTKKVSTLTPKSFYYETRIQKNYHILSIVNALKLGKSKLWSIKNIQLLVQTRLEHPHLTWKETAKELNKISLTKFSQQSCRTKWFNIIKDNPQLLETMKKKVESTSIPLFNIATRSSNVKN